MGVAFVDVYALEGCLHNGVSSVEEGSHQTVGFSSHLVIMTFCLKGVPDINNRITKITKIVLSNLYCLYLSN